MLYQIILFIINLLIHINLVHNKQTSKICKIDLKDFCSNAPLLVQSKDGENKIITPDSETLLYKEQDNITLACPGMKNKIKIKDKTTAVQSVNVTCENKIFYFYNKTDHNKHEFSEIKCSSSAPTANIITTQEHCAKDEGVIKLIQYNFDDTSIEMYKTCYDSKENESLYAVNSINGSYFQSSPDRLAFMEEEPKGKKNYTMNDFYTIESQNKSLANQLRKEYVTKNKYLARGHLAPNADFNLCQTKRSTFYYLNAAPQWQPFNNGNWKIVESHVRNLAKKYKTPLTIYTGVHGLLKLPNANNTLQTVYLNENEKRIPVPEYFWKVVYDKVAKAGVAFVGLNNIYFNKTENSKDFCKNVCKEHGLISPHLNNASRGLTICCKVDDIKNKIKRMTEVPSTTKLIKFK